MENIVYLDPEVLVSYTPFVTPYTHAKCSPQHLYKLQPITDALPDNSPYSVVYISERPDHSHITPQTKKKQRQQQKLKSKIPMEIVQFHIRLHRSGRATNQLKCLPG